MRVLRKSTDRTVPIEDTDVEIELRLHLHAEAEGEAVGSAIEDAHGRVMNTLMVGTLRAMLSPEELRELRDVIARLLTGEATEGDLDAVGAHLDAKGEGEK
jgi:hypothetical protein